MGGSRRPGVGSSRSGSSGRSRSQSRVPKINIPKIKRPKIKVPKIKVPDLRSKSPFGGGGSVFKEVKKCSGCNKVVSDSSRSGQRCPHCNILWSYEADKFGFKSSGSSSSRSSSRSPTRRVTSPSRRSSSSSFTDRLNDSSRRVDDALASARRRANTSYATRLTIKIITLCIFAGAAITGLAMRFS